MDGQLQHSDPHAHNKVRSMPPCHPAACWNALWLSIRCIKNRLCRLHRRFLEKGLLHVVQKLAVASSALFQLCIQSFSLHRYLMCVNVKTISQLFRKVAICCHNTDSKRSTTTKKNIRNSPNTIRTLGNVPRSVWSLTLGHYCSAGLWMTSRRHYIRVWMITSHDRN